MLKMILFNKEIPIRTHYCGLFDQHPVKIKNLYVNLFVRFKGCNASCSFCEYSDVAKKFNIEKYVSILREIKKNIFIKKISFTGGEPTLDFSKFKDVIMTSNEISEKSAFVVNTNGSSLKRLLNDDVCNYIDNISISRHHYKDEINNKILGVDSIKIEELKEYNVRYKDHDLIHFSCNLIKGYIDSKEEILNYLEYINEYYISSVGFVQLMPINDYCKDHFVDINLDSLLDGERFNFLKRMKKEGACECSNYIYIPKNIKEKVIKIYYKNTYSPEKMVDDLTFDGENLYYGFGGDKNKII